ncbi:GmrSD restriction endonuclease domain-containing protein [Achromobacter insuavis]|uniref:GmrSD restriction endonuclease domain-containing protein n=1 Tax=Achromobacter insuavis TaxID=1287735 RepID=UPI001EEB9F1A
MTDHIEHEDDFDEEDPRVLLLESLADGLATLSEASDMPDGVRPVSSMFSSDDVDFASDAWINQLAEIQGWLSFSEDLPLTGGEPFLQALIAELKLEPTDLLALGDAHPPLSHRALERLNERVDVAARLQANFLEELEAKGTSRATATQSWADAWAEIDASEEAVSPEPVTAKAAVWPIFQLTKKAPNLTPSYQRGDVWCNGDRQSLMESILRGVPLPSIILLRTGSSTPHEVVDGKQRLTAILRFVGKHPVAKQKVAEVTARHSGKKFNEQGRLDDNGHRNLTDLFNDDYPAFRRAWKALEGYALNSTQENEYYFPFKLRTTGDGGLVGFNLEPLRGKYYTQIKTREINVAGQQLTVDALFEDVVEYTIPVIEYTQASQAQIHEVFRLYNKQGVHLNAEEIRNAVYHEVELTRATLAAAGDADPNTDVAKIAESLAGVPELGRLGEALKNYGFGDTRYKRTKVLAWVISVLVHDTAGKDLASTSRNIDQLLIAIQRSKSHPLAHSTTLTKLFSLLLNAVELHSSHDELWSDQFKDGGKGAKWQELQLVGSLVGMTMALAASPDDIEDRIEANGDAIRTASAESKDWERPNKTQTKTQWDYIARISKSLLELLRIDPDQAAEAIRQQFGSSGYASLQRMLIKPKG